VEFDSEVSPFMAALADGCAEVTSAAELLARD
jgi:hypothetical protein